MDPISIILMIAGIALQVGSSLLQQANQPSPVEPVGNDQPRGFRSKQRLEGGGPRAFLVGTVASDGVAVYGGEWGDSNKTPNAFTVDVMAWSDLPGVVMTGLLVDGEEITYQTSSGHIARGYPVAEYNADSKDYLWHEAEDGTQSTASSYLVAKFGSHAALPWTTDFVGTGVAYSVFTARVNETLFSEFPEYRGVFQGIPLYDPRLDGSEDGTGSHRFGTQSTYEFSDNPAVIIYNILRGIQLDGDRVWGGECSYYELPYSAWSAAMDRCDSTVSLKGGGTEKRFRAGAEIRFDENPRDVIQRLLAACNGRITEVAGQYLIEIGVPTANVVTITDDDLAITDEFSTDLFPALGDTPNRITASFMDPSSGWTITDAAPRTIADALAADGGILNVQHMPLEYVFSETQVQRLQNTAGKEARRFRQHVLPLKPKFAFLEPVIYQIRWNSTRYQYSAKKFMPAMVEVLTNGNVVVALKEIDPSDDDWTPASDELDFTSVPYSVTRPAAQGVEAFSAIPVAINDGQGNARRPGIRAGYDTELDDVDQIRIRVDVKATGATVLNQAYAIDTTGYSFVYSNALDMLAGEEVEVYGTYENYSGARTFTTAGPIDVTLKNLKIGRLDLSAQLEAWRDFMGNSLQGTIDDLAEAILQISENTAASILDIATIHQEIGATVETASARLTSEYRLDVTTVASDLETAAQKVEVLTSQFDDLSDGQSAQVQALNALSTRVSNTEDGLELAAEALLGVEAGYDDITGGALLRFNSTFTPASGWDLRAGLEVRQTISASYKFGGIYFELKGGQVRTVWVGDQQVIEDQYGNLRGLFDSEGATFNNAFIRELTATHIKTKSLNADQVLIDGTTLTDHLAENAVTDAMAKAAGNKTVRGTDNQVTLISGNFQVKKNARVALSFNCLAESINSSLPEIIYRLKRGNSIVDSKTYFVDDIEGTRDVILTPPDNPGNGTKTYSVTAEVIGSLDGSTNGARHTNITMQIVGTKK